MDIQGLTKLSLRGLILHVSMLQVSHSSTHVYPFNVLILWLMGSVFVYVYFVYITCKAMPSLHLTKSPFKVPSVCYPLRTLQSPKRRNPFHILSGQGTYNRLKSTATIHMHIPIIIKKTQALGGQPTNRDTITLHYTWHLMPLVKRGYIYHIYGQHGCMPLPPFQPSA